MHCESRRRFLTLTLVGLALSVGMLPQVSRAAGEFPDRPLALVVPYPPGGSADIIARLIAAEMTRNLGQNVIVENRAGASAIIGTDHVAKSAPDGYTMIMGNVGSITIHPFTYRKLPYDPEKDLAPVSLLATVDTVLVANPGLPVKSIEDVIEFARKNPGKLTFSSSGVGSSPHLAGEFLKTRAGIDMRHISYRGSAPALVDVIGGQVDLMLDNLPSSLPHITQGKLRAIAVTGPERAKALPDTPAIGETMKGFEVVSWQGILVARGTPAPIVKRLNTAVIEAAGDPAVRKRLGEMGVTVETSTPEAFGQFIRRELTKWSEVVKAANVKLD